MTLFRTVFALGRPRLLPFVLVLPLVGYGWGHWDRALGVQGLGQLILTLAIWSLLHFGTMLLNAGLDKDSGQVLFGEPAVVPVYSSGLGYLVLSLTLVLGFAHLGWVLVVAIGLSIAYSHSQTSLKGHPVGGPLVNFFGYGVLSPYVGWMAVGVPVNLRSVVVLGCIAVIVLGCYFGAQAFQEEEDGSRGYRTLVVTHGAGAVIRASRLCVGSGILIGLILAGLGWLPRSCLLLLPMSFYLNRFFERWETVGGGLDDSWTRSLSWRLLAMAVVGVSLSLADYLYQSYHDIPVAGLGTVAGHPSDRPRLSPRKMRIWEAENGMLIKGEF